MFTSKQRSNLRSMAQSLEPIGQVGKGGIGENIINFISEALDKRELVKLTVLNNTEDDALTIGNELANALKAELVCVIGHKIVLYRRSDKKGVVHIKY